MLPAIVPPVISVVLASQKAYHLNVCGVNVKSFFMARSDFPTLSANSFCVIIGFCSMMFKRLLLLANAVVTVLF